MMDTWLPLLVPALLGPLTFLVMQGLKAASVTVDALPPVGKRLAVFAIASGLSYVSRATGVALPCDADAATTCLSALDSESVRAVLAAGVAYLLHFLKVRAPKAV